MNYQVKGVIMNNVGEIKHNPWAGLSSYQDPETSEVQLRFCGRDNESYDVTYLIDNNIFVTLYGKSGTGKSSLLNAGVFPRLRKERYLPLSIRLGMEARDISFQKCLINKIELATSKIGQVIDLNVVQLPDDEQATEYLWSYFACKRFVNNDGQTIFPVFVLDQFEEVFRDRRQEAETLLRQVYYMMDESHTLEDRILPDGSTYIYDYNYRFVVAIREDDLFRLEDSIDNNYLQNMKRCRYRLRNLSEQGAREAVLIPGEELFVEEEKDKIADTIINISRNKADQSISANILSLICNRIFEKCLQADLSHANLAMVETFVKRNPFEQFYREATKGLSNREKAYIETHMVDSEGRRNSIAETDFLLHVKNGALLFEGESRILQRSTASSDGSSYRIELRHDSFCATLAALKEKRERRKKIKQITSAIVAVLVFSGVIFLTIELTIAVTTMKNETEVIDKNLSLLNRVIINEPLLPDSVVADGDKIPDPERREIHDGIVYITSKPTSEVIDDWKEANRELCISKTKDLYEDYDINEKMMTDDPCLVYLILYSNSLKEKKEKQNWFDLYMIMTEEQIYKLYNILYGENYKLATINNLFEENFDKTKNAFLEDYSASELNNLAYALSRMDNWGLAMDAINKAILMEPNNADFYDSKGELLLDKGYKGKAVKMWEKVIELEPNYLDHHNGSTPFYEKLKKQNLIYNPEL